MVVFEKVGFSPLAALCSYGPSRSGEGSDEAPPISNLAGDLREFVGTRAINQLKAQPCKTNTMRKSPLLSPEGE